MVSNEVKIASMSMMVLRESAGKKHVSSISKQFLGDPAMYLKVDMRDVVKKSIRI